MSPSAKHTVNTVCKNINTIYKKIKVSEESPKTDYLFTNTEPVKSNLEKTIEKLDIISNMNSFVPRT